MQLSLNGTPASEQLHFFQWDSYLILSLSGFKVSSSSICQGEGVSGQGCNFAAGGSFGSHKPIVCEQVPAR